MSLCCHVAAPRQYRLMLAGTSHRLHGHFAEETTKVFLEAISSSSFQIDEAANFSCAGHKVKLDYVGKNGRREFTRTVQAMERAGLVRIEHGTRANKYAAALQLLKHPARQQHPSQVASADGAGPEIDDDGQPEQASEAAVQIEACIDEQILRMVLESGEHPRSKSKSFTIRFQASGLHHHQHRGKHIGNLASCCVLVQHGCHWCHFL